MVAEDAAPRRPTTRTLLRVPIASGARGFAEEVVVVRRRIVILSYRAYPGCGDGCSELTGHDPVAHEEHGYAQARADDAERRLVVSTGPLVVDTGRRRATVSGREVALTAREMAILVHLARRAGLACAYRRIVEDVWGPEDAEVWATSRHGQASEAWHALRVNVARLRARLAGSRDRIETVKDYGYRLKTDSDPTEER